MPIADAKIVFAKRFGLRIPANSRVVCRVSDLFHRRHQENVSEDAKGLFLDQPFEETAAIWHSIESVNGTKQSALLDVRVSRGQSQNCLFSKRCKK